MVTWRYKIPLLVLKNISNTRKEISYIIYSIYLMLPNLISSYPTYFFLSHLILTYYLSVVAHFTSSHFNSTDEGPGWTFGEQIHIKQGTCVHTNLILVKCQEPIIDGLLEMSIRVEVNNTIKISWVDLKPEYFFCLSFALGAGPVELMTYIHTYFSVTSPKGLSRDNDYI